MTPEERFTKIENAIQALTETQARHEIEIEKQNAGIRDLITVSRVILESQKEVTTQIRELRDEFRDTQRRTDAQIRELREAQKQTDEKLNALIDTVDRMIRNRNGHGNPG